MAVAVAVWVSGWVRPDARLQLQGLCSSGQHTYAVARNAGAHQRPDDS